MGIQRVDKYDLMKLTHGTEAEIKANVDALAEFEQAFATDTGKLFVRNEQGGLEEIGASNDFVKLEDQFRIKAKSVGNATTETDLKQLWETGLYRSSDTANKWINLPPNCGNAFTFRVESIADTVIGQYEVITVNNYSDARSWTCIYAGSWGEWAETFNEASCPISKNETGWCRLANGLLIQWGQSGGYEEFIGGFASKRIDVNLPVAFTDYTYAICGSEELGNDYGAYKTKIQFGVKNTSSFSISYIKTDADHNTYISGVKWVAIGY